jgi:molybdenum cofactor guanylyltransferase
MGTNKALLDVGGSGMLRRTAGLLRPLVDDLFIVADDPSPYGDLGLPVLPDVHRGRGALGGIHAAVARAAHPLVLCVACDMPHVAAAILELLLQTAGPADDALVPLIGGLPEPLLAVYGRGALAAAERSIGSGRLRIMDALAGLRVRFIDEETIRGADPTLRSFVNVNTPDELTEARAVASGGRP